MSSGFTPKLPSLKYLPMSAAFRLGATCTRSPYIASWSFACGGQVPFAWNAASWAPLSKPFSPGGRMFPKPLKSFCW